MPRAKTKAAEIRNKLHYCRKMIANEVQRQKIKQGDIDDVEKPLEENIFKIGYITEDDFFETAVCQSFLGWIETLENEMLYNYLVTLSNKTKIALTFYAIHGYSQREIAKIMEVSQNAIHKRLTPVIKQIENIF